MGRLFGHLMVMFVSFFRELWEMSGDVWPYFGDVFAWVWDDVGGKRTC